MFSTYERPSAEPLNGRCPDAPTCEIDPITRSWREGAKGLNTWPQHANAEARQTAALPQLTSHYTHEELELRTGIPLCALRDPDDGGSDNTQQRPPYAAIDVVRLAVVDRLVRSGVPVARAAALVRAAQSRVAAGI